MRIFLQLQRKLDRLENVGRSLAAIAVEGGSVVKVHFLEAILEESIAHVIRELHVALGARGVRLLRQIEEMSAEACGRGDREKEALGFELSRGIGREEAEGDALGEEQEQQGLHRLLKLSRILTFISFAFAITSASFTVAIWRSRTTMRPLTTTVSTFPPLTAYTRCE